MAPPARVRDGRMASYVATRFASLLATLVAASIVIFLVMEVLPGDPASFMLGLNADPATVAALSHQLGLDQPLLQRYLMWIAGFVHGDFGISYTYRVPVAELVAQRLWVSLPLALMALALAAVIAFPVGVIAATRRNQPADLVIMGATQLGIAVPNFWFAMLLVLAFSLGLHWFSAGGFPGWNAGFLAGVKALTLPAIALALPQASILARVMRSSLLDTLHEDFMRTARAKGLTAAAGGAPPCGAECADPGDDHHRPAVLLPACRGDHHRERLLPARPRPPRLPGDRPARPDRGEERGALARRRGGRRHLRRRSRLCGDRPAAEEAPGMSVGRSTMRRCLPAEGRRLHGSMVVGGVITVVMVAIALVSLVWTPYDPAAISIPDRLLPPSPLHWLGTDHFGRDVLSMLMEGARNSMAVALIAVGVGVGLGVPLGLLAAARRGWLDEVVMRVNDLVFAFPALLLAIMITALLGPGAFNAILAIGIFNVPVFARLTRGAALSLWTRDYVLAARVAGKGWWLISIEHILPNLVNMLVVQATIQLSLGILAEAALSYVGLGTQPPATSWGRMLADAQTMIALAPRLAMLPGTPSCSPCSASTCSATACAICSTRDGGGSDEPARGRQPHRLDRHDADPQRRVALGRSRRGARAGRGIGLGQVDDGALHHAPAARPGGRGRHGDARRHRAFGAGRGRMCAHRGRYARHGVPGADERAQPGQDDRRAGGRDGARAYAASEAEADDLTRAALDRVGLPAARFPLDTFPHELSGGQRQRVVIAMATVLKPKLLIADEPTTALDVTTQARILDLLRRLVGEDDVGLILISHDLAVVAEMADRIAIMKDGEVVEEGETVGLFRGLRHPYSRMLLAASTYRSQRTRRLQADEGHGAPILDVRHVTLDYRLPRPTPFARAPHFRAVDDVGLTVRRGENLGLVGESGSGKSTLARVILALVEAARRRGHPRRQRFPGKPRRGAARSPPPPAGGLPGPLWQPRSALPRGAADRRAVPSRPVEAVRRRAPQRVDEALVAVGLSPADGDKYPHEFSGGQRQRLAIARALITRPSLIVLDEAVSSLDVSIRAQILDLLADLGDRFAVSYLFISHDLTVVRAITDRVLIMRDGKIVEHGETERVFANPRHPYTAELIAATPDLERALAARAQRSAAPRSS